MQSLLLLLSVAATTALRLGAAPTVRAAATKNCAAQMGANKGALLFDCDGVLVETEELHRVAYNMAFDEFGLEIDGSPVVWSEDYYAFLAATVGGGKPKMRYHFTGLGAPEGARTHPDTAKVWPSPTKRDSVVPADEAAGMTLVDALQDFKTECYKKLVTTADPRPGVLELMDAAIATPGLAVGICSASTRAGFEKVVDSVVGQERLAKLDVIIAGDDVSNKKPHPEIYNVAAERLGLTNDACVVVEDSLVGLRAAKAAGMKCVITYTEQTAAEDFYGEGADAKLLDFSAGPTMSDLFDGSSGAPAAELLPALRDDKAAAADVPSVIVGGGRIGNALREMGVPGDVVLKRGEPIPAEPATGPIYVSTRNDDLQAIIDGCPPDRREDLVFMQNGMLGAFLEKNELADATQVLLYLAVAKFGEKPTDGITELNPDGLTAATGKWASTFATRLRNGGLKCRDLAGDAYTEAMLEKHVWICAFMLVGALNGGITVGEVEKEHSDQLRAVVTELCAAGEAALGVKLAPGAFERLAAYGRVVAHFPTAVKEFEWRNGWFYAITEAAVKDGKADPCPLHTAGLVELGVVKEAVAA